jgi:hypothetical protein
VSSPQRLYRRPRPPSSIVPDHGSVSSDPLGVPARNRGKMREMKGLSVGMQATVMAMATSSMVQTEMMTASGVISRSTSMNRTRMNCSVRSREMMQTLAMVLKEVCQHY